MKKLILYIIPVAIVALSCSAGKRIGKQASATILSDPELASAHIGISVFDPASRRYLFNYQAEKSFVPASNTKIFTCYAAMKNLGDSLTTLRYVDKGNGTVEVEANGDASFLMKDFKDQPAFRFLSQQKKILLTDANWKDNALGMGWAWDDYNSDYMAERSVMPIYGNLVHFSSDPGRLTAMPSYFKVPAAENAGANYTVRRAFGSGEFLLRTANSKFHSADIPFYTSGNTALVSLLKDTLHTQVELVHVKIDRLPDVVRVQSQPTDSLLRIMMHRSDNFFAEQTLLMISNEKLGVMNDARIIDTLLTTDFSGLPQKAKWVDGSGLSRYNLISPEDFVWVLDKMQTTFGWQRIRTIFSTGGEGTLSGSYKNYSGRIYAKTGTLSNHIALSGFITTRKGRQLIFSVLVNAHQTSAANVRKAVERFLGWVIDNQ